MTDTLRQRVEGWISRLGSTPVEIEDQNTSWHLKFDYPAKSQSMMHAVQPDGQNGMLILAFGVDVVHDHLEAFDELDAESQVEFLWELREAINLVDVDFKLEGIDKEGQCPKHMQISATRYDDGLNMDSFARSVGAVYKTFLKGAWTFQQHLGKKNGGLGGGRFDFKRLGY